MERCCYWLNSFELNDLNSHKPFWQTSRTTSSIILYYILEVMRTTWIQYLTLISVLKVTWVFPVINFQTVQKVFLHSQTWTVALNMSWILTYLFLVCFDMELLLCHRLFFYNKPLINNIEQFFIHESRPIGREFSSVDIYTVTRSCHTINNEEIYDLLLKRSLQNLCRKSCTIFLFDITHICIYI